MTNARYEFFGDDPDFPSKLITFTVLVGGFFGFLNETLLNVALTTIMADFRIGKTQVEWLTIGFFLVMGALSPMSARVVQWFSTRRMLMMILSTFLGGTLVCAWAPTFGVLLLGRCLQAAATAFMMPVIFNTMLLIYNPTRRGAVMGLVGMIFMAAPAIGPSLSGFITGHWGWRSLFFFTMPFTLLSLFLVWKYLHVNMQPVTRPKIDGLSVAYSAIGLGALVYTTATFAEAANWWQPALLLGAAWLLLVCFVRRQAVIPNPLLDLRVFRHRQFALGVALFAVVDAVFIGSELVMPMYSQQVVLLSSATAGLILLPGSLLNAVLAPLTGKALDKYGPRVVVLPGTIIMTLAFALMHFTFGLYTPAWLQALLFSMAAIAVAMVIMPAETNGLNALEKDMYPHGSAIVSTLQPIAGAMGSALLVGLITLREHARLAGVAAPSALQKREAMMSGVSLTYLLASMLGLLAIYLAAHLKKTAGGTHH